MKEKFVRFMQGRYGTDKLNRFLLVSAVVVSLISTIVRLEFLFIVSYILLGYILFRTLSKNTYRRYQENQKFLMHYNKVIQWFQKKKKRMQERKTYSFFKCPKCKQMVRVPKGKGKIAITCPKCREEFIKRT
ncbi:hypothetical protein [Anaerosacchariphilus polymeriproducens]|uniref:Zn-finger containing protein n=1 Tax=Anaerosacchariphilus polymeriproducens TaxID=1812858 RepID=A0A371AWU7_9FIRM|nr:hypothetical protein [Anaerosacchariphilus polymeriproducens]RDU24033.1 hypothetical protein DWV06_07000 [Anaerosacchariphilus polymeriproducens]